VEHPILPIDLLFHQDIASDPQELKDEIKKLTSDKSPGDNSITNRMIQAGGPKFQHFLHEVFGTVAARNPIKGMADVTDAANLQGWGQTKGGPSVIPWHLFE